MSRGHSHDHDPGGVIGGRLAVVLGITVVILIVEVIGAVISGSLALLADAGHMLTDAAGLSLAVFAAVLGRRPATATHTWGYRRAEVLAAAAQAAVLLAVGVFVLIQGMRRLIDGPVVSDGAMFVFGVIGLVANSVSLLVLARGRQRNSRQDFNSRAAFLEVVNDALGSVAVLVAAGVIAVTGWYRADAVVSILIGLLILPRTWKLLRETVDVLLEATPRQVDLDQVRTHIVGVAHVRGVHDLHASTVATGLPVLSAHVVVEDSCFNDGHAPQVLDELQRCLAGHFDVEHSTFQLEPDSHADHEHAAHSWGPSH